MKQELVFKNKDRAFRVAAELLQEENAVLITLEDDFVIVNTIYAKNSDRNEVVFQSVDEGEFVEYDKKAT